MLKLIVDEILSPPAAGGGGFAHLTEDAPYIVADWPVSFRDADGDEHFRFSTNGYHSQVVDTGVFVDFVNDGGAFELYRIGDVAAVFGWAEDGSLHWGDGTNPSDVWIGRDSNPFSGLLDFAAYGVQLFAPSADIQPDSHLEISHRTAPPSRSTITAANYIGDGSGGGNGFETAIDAATIGNEGWPSFMLTDWANYSNPIWGVYPSGKMVWSAPDGLSAPDTSLHRRVVGGGLVAEAPFLMLRHGSGEAANIVISNANNDSGINETASAYLGVGSDGGHLNLFTLDAPPNLDDPWYAPLLVSRFDDGNPRYTVNADGVTKWGDGTNPPDVSMKRNVDGSLGYALADGNGAFFSEDGTNASTFTRLDPNQIQLSDGSSDVVMTMIANHVLKLWGNGSGLQLSAPDGTAYNITVTNAGAIIATAA